MSRRVFVPLVAALLALSTLAPAVSAQGEPVLFDACFNGQITLNAADNNTLACSWGAKTKGLVQMFVKADVRSFVLTDASGKVVWKLDPDQAAAVWSDPVTVTQSDWGFECVRDVGWFARWWYPLGALEPGTYTLTRNETYLHPVNDGMHTCSIEGERIPPPSLYPAGPLPEVVVTITIV
jgi:hypothetical protein